MSRLYDTIEPNVVSDEMLQQAVQEQGPQGQAGIIAKEEGILFKDVERLRLDYRNILKIENLWQFTNLTKLQMDNNIIEKIEGLECLVNLVWLDLSFNNIEVIDGLDSLVKLEDLSLYHNRISKIENLDNLKKLQFFSIGNNDVDKLENIIYLRRLEKLEALCLDGNPIEQVEDYKLFVAAYLPNLVYLDYKLVDNDTRELAGLKYQYVIEELQHNENLAKTKQEEEQKEQEVLQLHKDAFVEHLNGPFLFDSLFAEDTEGSKLVQLPEVVPLLETYRSKFLELCHNIFNNGLKQHQRRQEELKAYHEGKEEAVKTNQDIGASKVAEFDPVKEQFHRDIQEITDEEQLKSRLAQYHSDIGELHNSLMMLEMQLLEQLKDISEDFERNMTEMVVNFIEYVQGLIAQLRDLEGNYNEKVLEIAINTLEKAKRDEFDEDIPEDVRMLFVDKDTVNNAVSGSHDMHLLKIDNREDSIVTRANKWCANVVTQVHREEKTRNRNRVSEINQYTNHLRDNAAKYELRHAA
ncbi:dynein regulatory complex subunit 3-like [Erpetoichthys calabaricus]|uniref:dynein regulatory complex subunit 3-like n=1 Tax=Erpetoichthys calabaricus TaxID=27687 RepID=UPI00109F8206|nr:dynein regulatory complex subunit 3-like [Erpetoichthys calabaricus]